MAAPRKMTSHYLNPIGGVAMDVEALNFTAKLSANVTIDPLYAGRCVSLNSVGEFETGVPSTAGKMHMPIFLFQDSDSPDVVNNGGLTGQITDEPNGWMGLVPAGQLKGLVAVGGYELETTEFESEVSLGSTYAPGDTLQATVANTTAATGGRLTKGTLQTHAIVGTVSRAVRRNEHGVNVLAFWPVCVPVHA